MATKIKIITAREFLEITPDGIIDITTSRQLLVDIAKAEHHPVDYELLVDLRHTESRISTHDVYQIASELNRHGDTFRRKGALLVLPGVNFYHARFFEACSHKRGFSVNAFTDYEMAIRWLLSSDDLPADNVLSSKAKGIDGK